MNTERIKEIQAETAYPDSVSVQQALLKVWNECQQELSNDHRKKLQELRDSPEFIDVASNEAIELIDKMISE